MSIEIACNRVATKTFWVPVTGTMRKARRRWIELYWLRWNVSILIDR